MADDASNCKEGNVCPACNGKDNLKLCSRCRNVFYCSREHQVEHWPIHRRTCHKVARTTNGRTAVGDGDSAAIDMSSALDSGAETGSPNVNQNNSPPPDSDELMRAFDHRALRLVNFPRPNSTKTLQLSKYVSRALKCDGYCVLDGIVSDPLCDKVLREVLTLERAGALKPGQLAGDNVVNRSIRSDKIMWFEGTELGNPAICTLLTQYMDSIVGGLNAHLGGEHTIKGKTKAMITCYPGDGTAYMKHIDNPSHDGRIITCIMYLNKNWDVKTQGGLLRLFPSSRPGDYVDIAPIMNRMILFWSDSRNPHEVQPSFDNRYAVTLWYFDRDERLRARQKGAIQDQARSKTEATALLQAKPAEMERTETPPSSAAASQVNGTWRRVNKSGWSEVLHDDDCKFADGMSRRNH
ncbi:Egl nine-like protein 1 [Lamellibrachia satsuma]|nr:Egl nine-like protein 1 [Lamellibrachia satsuma]